MTYTGSVDQDAISDLETQLGKLIEDADELGFVLTYHAAKGDKCGVMDLVGRGITQELLVDLFAEALAHNASHGSTL